MTDLKHQSRIDNYLICTVNYISLHIKQSESNHRQLVQHLSRLIYYLIEGTVELWAGLTWA